MFPAQAGTGRHTIIHHQVPYWKHMFPYSTPAAATAVPSSKRLKAQKAVPAPAPRSMVACLDDFSVTLHQLPDSSTVGFRKRLLASKSSSNPDDEDESDIVAELRYDISGRYGVTCFDVDAGGRGFVYSTAERTSAVRLTYSSGSASSVEPLTLWEADGVAPLPPATALTLHEGSLYLAHADGVVVVKDIFSPAEDLAARLRQVVSLPSPAGATSIAVTPAGAVVLGSGAASEGGVVTVLTRRAAPAAAKGGKKRTAAEAAGGDFAGFDVSLTKSVRQEIVDLTLCEVVCAEWVLCPPPPRPPPPPRTSFHPPLPPMFHTPGLATQKGTQCVFVVLRDGCVAAYSLTDGKSVWSMSNMPAAPRGFALPNRCDAAGQHVLVWNGEYVLGFFLWVKS